MAPIPNKENADVPRINDDDATSEDRDKFENDLLNDSDDELEDNSNPHEVAQGAGEKPESVSNESSSQHSSTRPAENDANVQQDLMTKNLLSAMAAFFQSQPSVSEVSRNAELDRSYVTPPFVIRQISENEKLSGARNFQSWRRMLNIDLGALNLHPLIQTENGHGIMEVSPSRRSMLNAQCLLYVRASVSRNVAACIQNASTAFEAVSILENLYNSNRVQDLVRLHARFHKLRFQPHYSKERFVASFERVIEEYELRGSLYSDESKATAFIEKIPGIYEASSPFFAWYNNITAQPHEAVSFQYVKERFIAVDTSSMKSSETSYLGRSNKRRNESDTHSNKKAKFSGGESSSSKANSSGGESSSSKPAKSENAARPLREKYSEDQLSKLRTMSKEEKRKIACQKCGEYFHMKDVCPNPGRMCFQCKQYGHTKKTCKYNPENKSKN